MAEKQTVNILMLGALAWLLNHPYVGIDIHDAKLYAVLAAHWLEPAAYARDPFFMFGSQDDFTLFSPVYGVLIRWFGLDVAAQLIVISGASLLAVAVTLISKKLYSTYWAQALAVMLCVAASYAYSPSASLSFRINEEFATARVLAVPLALLAIAINMHGRHLAGLAIGILATLIHPLMGIWAVLFLISIRSSDRTLLWLLASGILCLAGASLIGVAPLQPLDAEWDALMRPLSVVYVGAPHTLPLGGILFWLTLPLLAGQFGNPAYRRWYQAVVLLGVAGLLFAQLASYLYPIKLILQVQLWRAMWLVIFFALLAATDILEVAAHRGKRALLWLALGTVLIYLTHGFAGYFLLALWIAAQSPTVRRLALATYAYPGASTRTLSSLLAILVMLALPSYLLDLEQLGYALPVSLDILPPALSGALFAGGLGLGFLAIALLLAHFAQWKGLSPTLAALLLVSGMYWDQRGPLLRVWESRLLRDNAAGDVGKYIQRGDVVYWPENAPMRTWLELGTASYASGVQPAGSIFSREKTFEMKRRLERVAIASAIDLAAVSPAEERRILARVLQGGPDALAATNSVFTAGETRMPTGPGIAFLCQDPFLDWVVMPTRHTHGGLSPLRVADPQTGRALFLYRCRKT